MQVTVDHVSTVKKALHIEIPGEEVKKEVDAAYQNLKKTAKVKGFRPGKTPRSVLERLYKDEVRADVAQNLIQGAFVEAVRKENLQFLGAPSINPPPIEEFDENAPFKFDVTVEVKPEIGVVEFRALSLKRPLYAYTEEEVDGQIQMLRKRFAKKEAISETRPAVSGDFILIDYEGKLGDEPFVATPKTENHAYLIGRNTLSPAFDEKLSGMNPGETRTFEVSYDENYVNKAFHGKTVTYEVTLKEIHQEVLPELDDAFAKSFGAFETLEDLKNKIRENLQQGYNKRIEQELNEQVFTQLLEKLNFEVPEVMVEYELDATLAEAEQAFMANGISFEQMGMTPEALRDEYRELAEKQVRRHLILGAVIEQEKLGLTKEELEDGLRAFSKDYNQPMDVIQSFYNSNPEKLEFFKHTLLEKKAVQLIVDNAVITDAEPEAEVPEGNPDAAPESGETEA